MINIVEKEIEKIRKAAQLFRKKSEELFPEVYSKQKIVQQKENWQEDVDIE